MNLADFKKTNGMLHDLLSMPLFARSSFDLFFASVGINTLALALPIILMQVYDRIVPTQASSTLLWLVIGFGCTLLLESALRLSRSTITNWSSARFEHDLGYGCVSKWLTCNLEEFENDGAGVHLDRLRAVNTLKSYYAGQAFQLLLDLPFALVFLAATAFLSGWKVPAYLLAVATIFLIIIALIRGNYSTRRLRQKQFGDRRYNFLVEALSGIHTIKSLTLEESMLRRHERLEAESAKSDFDVIFIGNLPISIGNAFSQFILFGVLFVGGSMVISGSMTLGSLAACTLLSGRFFQPFRSLASFWVHHADVLIAKEQIRGIAQLNDEADPSAPCMPMEIEGVMKFRNVSFRYSENSPLILDDVTLRASAGEMICLAAHGSKGTSTILNLMFGNLAPTEGQVVVDNLDMSQICHSDFKGRIEYLPQQGSLFNGTIFDNLTLYNPAHRDAALDAASLLRLDEVLSELPLGFETQVGNRLYEFLPTGVIQRICLARALTIRPRILLLDKTNDAMDTESERIFLWLLQKLKGHCTIIMATANPVLLAMADRCFAIENAKLVEMEAAQCF